MKTSIRRLDGAYAVLIPTPIWERLALPEDDLEIALEDGALVVRAIDEQDPHGHALPMRSVPAPLAPDTPVWDDYNDPEEWNSLSDSVGQESGADAH